LTIPAEIAQQRNSDVFNLSQIIRELVSNIIRHANADSVSCQIQQSANGWQFILCDNGQGLPMQHCDGNGMNNLKQRISELNGDIAWNNQPEGGLCVTFQFPIP